MWCFKYPQEILSSLLSFLFGGRSWWFWVSFSNMSEHRLSQLRTFIRVRLLSSKGSLFKQWTQHAHVFCSSPSSYRTSLLCSDAYIIAHLKSKSLSVTNKLTSFLFSLTFLSNTTPQGLLFHIPKLKPTLI